jgi:hypothetical protein
MCHHSHSPKLSRTVQKTIKGKKRSHTHIPFSFLNIS